MTVVIIDNYDSFTHNLAHCVAAGGRPFKVLRNTVSLAEIDAAAPTHLVLSPGPGDVGDPASYGVCEAALAHYAGRVPVLGVCLGHQVVAKHYGARVRRCGVVRHGWVSAVDRTAPSGLFTGIGARFTAMRYHSLAVAAESLPADLRITCVAAEDGEVMAVQHRRHAVYGIQFHPESIGTEEGPTIMRNFLRVSPGSEKS
ncbi:hypothetical protein BFF78_15735 [Streptomyces fodineus]|uniref:Aminodeoxychorismate synthase n=1 Tax=Streptomyces fodineus TaxID=1904616 RepID=A0A1D7YA15_9ACTN|nr:aminodeoxychorismate/anthranilate synthase component II [Streptomyces fodineus]AOR32326.1 hypothetical protein BFF78_15735 [Streptomyces fodineus]